MANKDAKVSENVTGKYYVDDQCIACGVCEGTAPENFKLNNDGTHAFVAKQPENDVEENQVKDAMNSCPSNSIGDDGE
ncbi:MAG: ferredoxin [Candidatus Goldbacteria bacterium]|nr:ferredoxin [Candidatus Goldiibacteriota bacterium]HPD18773.1 ferredoxin [Candidatus Goldiibacteriota bacterium]